MNNQDDMMMKESLHELVVEMKKLTAMCDGITDSDDFDLHLITIDKLSTILKRFTDMGYNPLGELPKETTPPAEKPVTKKGKEESE